MRRPSRLSKELRNPTFGESSTRRASCVDLLRSTSRTTWSQGPRKYEDIHDGFSSAWQTTEIQFASHESPLRFLGMEVKVVLSDEGDAPWTRRCTSKKFFDGTRLGYDRSPAFRRRRNRDVPQNPTSSFPGAYEKAEPTTEAQSPVLAGLARPERAATIGRKELHEGLEVALPHRPRTFLHHLHGQQL